MITSPLDTLSWPAIMRSVEVLPQPEGPSRQQYLPPSISRSIASTAIVSPYFLVSAMSSMSEGAGMIPVMRLQ